MLEDDVEVTLIERDVAVACTMGDKFNRSIGRETNNKIEIER